MSGATPQAPSRDAWVPVDRAAVGSVVSLIFQMEDPTDYTIVECNALVVDGKMLPYMQSEPIESGGQGIV